MGDLQGRKKEVERILAEELSRALEPPSGLGGSRFPDRATLVGRTIYDIEKAKADLEFAWQHSLEFVKHSTVPDDLKQGLSAIKAA